MNWLTKLPHYQRAHIGLEWRLWRKLPLIALIGTLLPLLCLGLIYWYTDLKADVASTATSTSSHARWLQMMHYVVGGVIIFHWSMVITVGIGCIIVMIMKGPGYVADGYQVSHSDQPRTHMETLEEKL